MAVEYTTAKPSDLDFVVASWLDSYQSSYSAGLVQMNDWRAVMDPQIRKVLARPGVELYVARNPEADPDLRCDAHGWLACERGFKHRTRKMISGRWKSTWEQSDRPLVHYIYVKSAYRKRGIARGLFRAAEIDPIWPFYFTCKTPIVRDLMRVAPGAEWNPLFARFEKKDAA